MNTQAVLTLVNAVFGRPFTVNVGVVAPLTELGQANIKYPPDPFIPSLFWTNVFENSFPFPTPAPVNPVIWTLVDILDVSDVPQYILLENDTLLTT